MPSLKRRVSDQESRVAKTRSRVISHAKAGRRAPRLRRLLARQRGTLARLRQALARSRDPRTIARRWAAAQVGTVESPPGSNRGGNITIWQKFFGAWLVGLAWCGVFVGRALAYAGVAVTHRVASVANIEDDAKAGRNGFKLWRGPREGRAGDVAVLFARGVHVELIAKRVAGGYITYGGNTSPEGGGGSQSNGGGVYRRFRPYSQVHGIAVPDYPN
ncbi:MAG: hypothetical protein KGZ65_06235 [Sphingomonadales bacterium]|nr:hypothetical protein [Sphingomonadaceae bacterium]MBS3930818.1 hypothetical protein [Sphingomonadales bacterium]